MVYYRSPASLQPLRQSDYFSSKYDRSHSLKCHAIGSVQQPGPSFEAASLKAKLPQN